MAQYTASGIIYARATPENLAIAISAEGGTALDITERINPPTLAAGQITCVPTSVSGTFDSVSTSGGISTITGDGSSSFNTELNVGQVLYSIDANGKYVLLGTIASITDATHLKLTGVIVNTPSNGDVLAGTIDIVSGIGTEFDNGEFDRGKYLFAYDYNGAPFLVGQIQQVTSPTQIVLTQYSSAAVAVSAQCGWMDSLLRQNDSILIRIPTIVQNGQTIVPNWASLRLTPLSAGAYNDTTKTNLSQYSVVGDRLSISNSSVNDPFTIVPQNKILRYKDPNSPSGYKLFINSFQFPEFTFALYNPWGTLPTALPPATMFKLFTSETMLGVPISVNMPDTAMVAAGYSFIDVNS